MSIIYLPLILTGFSAVIIQSVLVREYITAFSGNELSIGIIFACWLLWTAMGNWAGSYLFKKIQNFIKAFSVVQISIAFIVPITIVLIRMVRIFITVPHGEIIGIAPMFFFIFIITLPVSFLCGLQFYFGYSLYNLLKKDIILSASSMYIFEALGALIGGILFSYLLVSFYENFSIIIFVSITAITSMLILVFYISSFKQNRYVFLKILGTVLYVLVIIGMLTGTFSKISQKSAIASWKQTGVNIEKVLFTKYGMYTAQSRGSVYSVFGNGSLIMSSPFKSSDEMTAHIPLLQAKNPKRVLVIGASGITAVTEILKHKIEQIDVIEKDEKLTALLKEYLYTKEKLSLKDSSVHFIHTDARLFIKTFKSDLYDCVILNIGDPLTISSNRYYTKEFFKEVSGVITEQGIFSFAVSSNEDYMSLNMRNFNARIYYTLKDVFSNVIFVPGGVIQFLASESNKYLTNNPEIISARIQERNIKTEYVTKDRIQFIFDNTRINFIENIFNESMEIDLNKDFMPLSFYDALSVYSSRFGYILTGIFEKISLYKWYYIFICAGLILILVLFLFKKENYTSFVVAYTGFAAMAAQLMIIYGFQICYGNVYIMVGALVAAFMGGIALGTFFIKNVFFIKSSLIALKKVVIFLQLIFGLFIIILYPLLAGLINIRKLFLHSLAVYLLFPMLALTAGFCLGAVFPLANKILLHSSLSHSRVPSRLYAYDLLGGC
ncbi:spermidine synthase, partial [bacterium]